MIVHALLYTQRTNKRLTLPNPDSARTKTELRAWARTFRSQMDGPTYTAARQAIAMRVLSLHEVQSAHCIHCYWPMLPQREVDTRPMIRAWLHEGKAVVLPRILSFTTPAKARPALDHVRLHNEAALRPNRWGIYEPTGAETVPPGQLDLVIVPALALDYRGYRLGQGGGYYDTFLADVPAPKIGIVYEACLLDALPAEPHDIRLDLVVTEKQVIRTRPLATS